MDPSVFTPHTTAHRSGRRTPVGREFFFRPSPLGLAFLLALTLVGCKAGGDSVPESAPPVFKEFLYVANIGTSNVSGFSVDTATGAVTPVPGSPFPAGPAANKVAVHTAGRFLYVSNYSGNSISGYSIGQTGALTALAGSPFSNTGGAGPASLALHPNGKFLFVANLVSLLSGSISVMAINPSTGALAPVAGSPFESGGTYPSDLDLDAFGAFLFVTCYSSNSIPVLAVNSGTGALTPIPGSPFAAPGSPFESALDGNGHLFSANNSGSVGGYTIAGTGALTPLAGYPVALGGQPCGIQAARAGALLYVGCQAGNVAAFTLTPTTGQISALPGSPFVAGANTCPLALDPSSKMLFAANYDSNNLSAFTVAANGTLAATPSTPIAAGTRPFGITYARLSF